MSYSKVYHYLMMITVIHRKIPCWNWSSRTGRRILLFFLSFILLQNIIMLGGFQRRFYSDTYEEWTSGRITKYVVQFPPETRRDAVDRLTPDFPSTFLSSLRSSFYRISSGPEEGLPSSGVLAPPIPNFFGWGSDDLSRKGVPSSALGETLDNLLDLITKPKRKCRKLVGLGGFSCMKKPEGRKNICLDDDVHPEAEKCFIYSFGVGHDFSFDKSAVNYGCAVFAFDSDSKHSSYPRHITDNLIFIKARLGHAKYRDMHKSLDGLDEILYRPLHQIVKSLNHQNISIDVMKFDIESSEWRVFEKSIYKTKILEKVKQISLEIHLDDFKEKDILKNQTRLLESAEKYLRVIRGLETRGFRLAHYEPNYVGTKVVTIENRTFHLFCETLWLNPSYKYHLREDYLGSFYQDYEYPPRDLLPFTRPPNDTWKS